MQKIIVRFPNWLGDLVMAQPVLKALKEAYPASELTVLMKDAFRPLLKYDPDLARAWALEETSFERLQKERFDLGVLLTNSFSSAWLFFKGKVKTRLGYRSDLRSPFLNLKVYFPKKMEHQIISYQRLLFNLKFPFAFAVPSFYVKKEEKDQALQTLLNLGYQEGKKIIAFAPFAAFGGAKCWPIENYLLLAEKLAQKGFFIVFLGEKKLPLGLQKKYSAQNFFAHENILDLTGKTELRDLMVFLDLADLVLTNDSGPMHLAAALKKEQIAIFGSTNPALSGPFYNSKAKVLYKKFSCSPCYKRECPKKQFCLQQITVEEVLNKIINKLKTQEMDTVHV